MIFWEAIKNQAAPSKSAIAPHRCFFSQKNSHKPIATTVRDKTALQLKTNRIAVQNHTILFKRAAKIAAKIAGKAITSG